MMSDIYHEAILDLYKNPLHSGEIEQADLILDKTNSSCGDSLKIYLKLKGEQIIDLKWQGSGCAISQVSMSALADHILTNKMTISQVKKMTQTELLKLLGLESINPGREKCLMMSLMSFLSIKA